MELLLHAAYPPRLASLLRGILSAAHKTGTRITSTDVRTEAAIVAIARQRTLRVSVVSPSHVKTAQNIRT